MEVERGHLRTAWPLEGAGGAGPAVTVGGREANLDPRSPEHVLPLQVYVKISVPRGVQLVGHPGKRHLTKKMCVAPGETGPTWVVLSFSSLGLGNVTGEGPASPLQALAPLQPRADGPAGEARAIPKDRTAAGASGSGAALGGGPGPSPGGTGLLRCQAPVGHRHVHTAQAHEPHTSVHKCAHTRPCTCAQRHTRAHVARNARTPTPCTEHTRAHGHAHGMRTGAHVSTRSHTARAQSTRACLARGGDLL